MTTLAVAEPYIVQFLEDYSDKAPGCMTFEIDFNSRLSI